MSHYCDFQAQVDFSDENLDNQTRSKSSMKVERRRPIPGSKGLFPYRAGLLSDDLKNDVHVKSVQINIKSVQKRFIPIQSVLPSLKINRTSKSVKEKSSTKRIGKISSFIKKRSFANHSERISSFFRFQNYYLHNIN